MVLTFASSFAKRKVSFVLICCVCTLLTSVLTDENVRAYLEGLQSVQLCGNLRFISFCLPINDSVGLYNAGRLHLIVNLAWLLPPCAHSLWIYLDSRESAVDYHASALFDVNSWAYLGECLAASTVRDVVVRLVTSTGVSNIDCWPSGFVDSVTASWVRYRGYGTCLTVSSAIVESYWF